MSKIFTFSLLFLISVGFAQQIEKYYKIQMIGKPNEIKKQLSQKNIALDHAHISNERIITEVSESELNLIKTTPINYEILISDVAKFYQDRNNNQTTDKIGFISNCEQFNFPKPIHFHLGSMGGFYTYPEMLQIIDSMALLYPNLISAKQPISTTQSIEGRPIYFVKISDNPSVNEPEPQVLYTALHHAREAESLSQLIFYMWYLLENYSTNADVKHIIDTTELYFIPCVNPDGYIYNHTTNPSGGGMWRKNRKNNGDGTYGIDLNRNYGYQWGYDNVGSSPTTSSDAYRGTSAFSEPETQAIKNFCTTHQFKIALNAHTYSNLLIYPWGYIPSYLTPDSVTYINWAENLVREDRFLFGTADQTVNYITNGDSDDWMYGDQSTKPKIMAMTPEAGSPNDGFWPLSSRIIDIAKTTFYQNLKLAQLATNFAIAEDKQDNFITTNGYLKYSLNHLGIVGNGVFTVSIIPIFGITAVGSGKSYTLSLNQQINDSISFSLAGGLTAGQTIKYIIATKNGSYTHNDTIKKIYGVPITLINDNGNNISNWNTNGWGTTTASYQSAPSSITDSPSGNYANNTNKYISLKNSLDLTNAIYAHMQYYTKFALEKNYDDTQILISTNGGSAWSVLCSKYQTPPVSFGGASPLYDGHQLKWVKEEIDLTPYIGNSILIKFVLTSDAYSTEDGFYFDDFVVRKIINTTSVVEQSNNNQFEMYPNPSSNSFSIKSEKFFKTIEIYNSLGEQLILVTNINTNEYTIETNLENGIYFVKIEDTFGQISTKKMIINK